MHKNKKMTSAQEVTPNCFQLKVNHCALDILTLDTDEVSYMLQPFYPQKPTALYIK
jgi:hypothetical protein